MDNINDWKTKSPLFYNRIERLFNSDYDDLSTNKKITYKILYELKVRKIFFELFYYVMNFDYEKCIDFLDGEHEHFRISQVAILEDALKTKIINVNIF